VMTRSISVVQSVFFLRIPTALLICEDISANELKVPEPPRVWCKMALLAWSEVEGTPCHRR
jgi:hypothetical protein